MIEELIRNHSWFLYLLLGLVSLAIGSLLNLVIYRLPIMLKYEWRQQCQELLALDSTREQSINLFYPRSFCPKCKSMIKAWQNIPLLSYFILKGRCNQCNTTISIRYPLIELFTFLVSLFATWHFGFTLQLPFALLAIWLLIAMFFIDLDHQLLPDSLTLGLLWVGLIANSMDLFTALPVAVLSAAGAYLSIWSFIKIYYLISGKIGMGHGDFKLFAALGAWFGWAYLPLILLVSSISGVLIGILYLRAVNKTKETPIPFGPFLCISGLITLFWGNTVLGWYLNLWI
ncbi:MAG TPA: A24 family peptidase [Legionella sp.]|nr:A24 family peptidase [Legionella sp.]